MLRPIWGLCALSILAPVSVRAQGAAPAPAAINPSPSAEPEISLDVLLQLAAQNNPQPAIARANLEAARARVQSLGGLQSPVLQIVPGVFGNRDSRDEEIILSQPLDVFGSRRAQRSVLSAEARRAEAEFTLIGRTLAIEVKNAAAQLFAAQEAESLGVSQVEIARQFRAAAARRAQLGDVPPVQVQRAELELSRAQNELENARAERLARRAILNQLVGQAPQTPFRVAIPTSSALTDLLRANAPLTLGNVGAATGTTTGVAPGLAPSLLGTPENLSVGASSQVGSDLVANRAQILPQALAGRPDLLGAQASLEARRANVNAIARSRFPQVEIQARRGGVFDGASTSLRAVITLPLFDFGNIKNQKRAAQAEVRAQEGQIALLRSQIGAQVESALVRLEQQRATIERYRTSIVPQTLDLLRKTQVGYAQGASTYLEVLEAQRATRQVQTEYLQAVVGVRTSEAALESAFGASLPAVTSGPIQNPGGPARPDGVAPPGTIPPGTIPNPGTAPINPPSAQLPPSGAPVPGEGTR